MIARETSDFITNEEIKVQLKKILESPKFLSSQRLSRFLEYVIIEFCSNQAENIKAYNIAIAVFDRETDFDPQVDPIVRIYAGRLRLALSEYYANSKNNSIQLAIPKGSYKPEFSKIKSSKKLSILATSKAKFRIYAAVFLIFIAGSFIYFDSFNNSNDLPNQDDFGRMYIAIETFKNLSDNSSNEQLGLRLTENTQMAISQFSSLVVVEPTKKYSDVANYNLLGSIQQRDDIVSVIIKLIDAESGIQVFSKEYKSALNSTTTNYLEAQVANKIAIDLADEFGVFQAQNLRTAQNKSQILSPHKALLFYYDYLGNINPKANADAIKILKESLNKINNYAPTWSALAGLYMDRYMFFDGSQQDLESAKYAIQKAEALNPHNVHVQEHLALISYATGNLEALYNAAEMQKSLNANSTMLGQIGLWFSLVGDYKRGIPLIEKAIKNNPYYPKYFHIGYYFYYLEKGDLEKALIESEQIQMPQLFWDPLLRAVILEKLGNVNAAKLALKELLALKPNFSSNGPEIMKRALYLEKYRKLLLDGLNGLGLDFE